MEHTPSFVDSLQADVKPSYSDSLMHGFDDKKFGLPKAKKYPMPDVAHVRSAIKFFNYVDRAHEKELAKAILARMREYGIDPSDINVGDTNRFKKYLPQTELKHHGIKGMKWGIRRYQNLNGSLTSEGRKRYGYEDKTISSYIDKQIKRSRLKNNKIGIATIEDQSGNVLDVGYFDTSGYSKKELRKASRFAKRFVNSQKHRTVSDELEAEGEAFVRYLLSNGSDFSKQLLNEHKQGKARYKTTYSDLLMHGFDDKKFDLPQTELKHHGIKGMRWGVRRYQNPDGTLTPAGEKRYLKKLNKASKNEMVSDYFARKHYQNVRQLSEFKQYDPENFRKKVPAGLLEQEQSRMHEWVKRNKKDIAKVRKWMNKMNLDKKHLAYDITTHQYAIVED